MLTADIALMTPPIQTHESPPFEACEGHHLLSQVATGDGQAFQVLYSRYTPRIQSYLRRHLNDPESLDEALDDVMMVIWQKPMDCPAHVPLLAWLYGIARYTARTYSRRSVCQDVSFPEVVSEEEEPEVHLLAKDQKKTLDRAISNLPHHERQPVELLVYHGCSYKDIAIRLDVSINTIKTRIMRARTRLTVVVSNSAPIE